MISTQNKKSRKTAQLFLISFFLLLSSNIRAQGNLPYVDDKPIHFGFMLGSNLMSFAVEEANENELYRVDVSTLHPGFTAGFIADLRLSRYFNLRFTPFVSLSERELTYSHGGGVKSEKEFIFSIPLSLPLHIKYSSERIRNYRPYLLAGVGTSVDFGRNKEKNVLLNPFDFYIDFGVGCDLYFYFFKLAPELRFSIGFNNMLTPSHERPFSGFDSKYSNALSSLTTKMISLSFNFE